MVAYAGKPDVERRSRGESGQGYDVLGYGCAGRASAGSPGPYLIACRTAFYLVRGRLGLFFTHDRRFSIADGVRIGMRTAPAERLLRPRVCTAGTTIPA